MTRAELDPVASLVGKWRREAYALERGEEKRPVPSSLDLDMDRKAAAALERCATELEATIAVLVK